MTDDDFLDKVSKQSLQKRVVANECVALLCVLPRHQLQNLRLEWLRMRDLRQLYKEIKKTYVGKD